MSLCVLDAWTKQYNWTCCRPRWGNSRWIVLRPASAKAEGRSLFIPRCTHTPHSIRNGVFFIKILAILHTPYPGSLISKHTLECQRHLPFAWSISAERPSLSNPLQQNVTISHLGWENKLLFFTAPPSTPELHVRISRRDNLRLWTANVTSATANQSHFFSLASVALLWGSRPWHWDRGRRVHMNKNESAGLSGVASRGSLKCQKIPEKQGKHGRTLNHSTDKYITMCFFFFWSMCEG